MLRDLNGKLGAKQQESSKETLNAFMESFDKLLADFQMFKDEKRQKSETFVFLDNFLELVAHLRNLIWADREGK